MPLILLEHDRRGRRSEWEKKNEKLMKRRGDKERDRVNMYV